MSQAPWSKTPLAQAIGLTVAGASTVTATDALAQENIHLRITALSQNFQFDSLSSTKYSSHGSGEADASDSLHMDLTVPVAPAWDVRLSVKNSEADGKKGGPSYPENKYVTIHFKSSLTLDSEVIDFEAGHHMKLGQQDVRVFAGLRYMDLDTTTRDSIGYSVFSKYIALNSAGRTSELEALGLRAGAETSIPLAKGLSANGLVAFSAVQGDRENTGHSAKYTSSFPLQDDKDDIWLGTELEASVTWDPSPETDTGPTLSLGYAWSRTNDLLSTSVMNNKSDESDLTERSVFARVDFAL